MSNSFSEQLGIMILVFGLALIPGLFSRRMERSDHLTLVAIPIAAFLTAVLPGILTWGFDKNSATYVLGALIVIVVATLNYRFQPPHAASEAQSAETKATAVTAPPATER